MDFGEPLSEFPATNRPMWLNTCGAEEGQSLLARLFRMLEEISEDPDGPDA